MRGRVGDAGLPRLGGPDTLSGLLSTHEKEDFMRRIGLLVGLVLAAATLFAAPVAGAKPPPLTSVLAHDGNCGFTVTAGWSGVKVGSVYGMWVVDNQGVTGTFANVGKGRTVTMTPGPGTAATGAHSWSVVTHFFSGPGMSGVLVGQVTSNEVSASCVLEITPQ